MRRTADRAAWLAGLARMLTRPDVLVDLHIYGGLAVAGWGGWQLSPPWTAVALGLLLVALALWPRVAFTAKRRAAQAQRDPLAGSFGPHD
jgi:uncharacterized membrane protein